MKPTIMRRQVKMDKKYDFAGWATKADMRCSDGRLIAKDAFAHQDGAKVPIVWNHNHATPDSVLGYGILHSQNGSMRVECYFNDTENGKNARKLVLHGDINALSIYANQLKEQAKTVLHGMIREVSLVYAGANPGAFIDSVVVHADGTTTVDHEQGILYTGEEIELFAEIEHADDNAEKQGETKHTPEKPEDDKETMQDILNTLTEKQKDAVAYIIDTIVNSDDGAAEESDKDSDVKHNSEMEEEENEMKRNVFDKETENKDAFLSHADGEKIIEMAKAYGGGSLKAAMEAYVTENKKDELAHAAAANITNISQLFPEYKDVKPGAPELLTTDQGWIGKVLTRVHKSPISRIRTRQADVRDISARRAKGYTKGSQKTDAGTITLLSRTTDPVTVYIRSKLDRDDIVDITDFDTVQYMYGLDRMNLNEELARQITIGDGRSGDNAIDPTKMRPIWLDDDLYCIHKTVDINAMRTELTGTNSTANFGENYVYAEAVIQSLLYAREKWKGSGNPDFLCTPHLVNVMLLARDLNGRRIYDNVNELKAALNVNEIITAEQFAGKTRTATVNQTEKTFELLGLMVNFADYSLGATKGGEITHFTDFDINFNQEVSLLETRSSGALTRPFSAIALEKDVTVVAADDSSNT
nr:MAG TPA: major capsid protein [Caudoviricetes sp.]